MQKITTTGNATIIAYDEIPILVTDPWIGDEESAYFGSWILSHKIPEDIKNDIFDAKFVWFSHGHPDHLNPISVERFRRKKILLGDHIGSRIYKSLSQSGFDVEILPDRKWINLTDNIKIQCITTYIQDSILLIDVCGKLFINLNDAGTRSCSKYIRNISKNYIHSFALQLSGYGDADMINFFDENGQVIAPSAARRPEVGKQLNEVARLSGAKNVIPFSSFHKYQRQDSIWASQYTTPLSAYSIGISKKVNLIDPFCTINCNDLSIDNYQPEELNPILKDPLDFGDNYTDELDRDDRTKILKYFERKDKINKYFGFINFNVGGKDTTIKMNSKSTKGISFSVPRNSLMQAIEYRIFDDLLIANFMKTTLYNCGSLYEGSGNFNFNVTKFGDNGYAETDEEIQEYLKAYMRRAGYEMVLSMLEDKSREFLLKLTNHDSRVYQSIKSIYLSLK